MGKVVLDMTMTLDGCVAGPDKEPGQIHDWYFTPSETSSRIVEERIAAAGALIVGRRAYDLGVAVDGYVDNPYKMTHLVVTHEVPATPAKGDTHFVFVTDGVESAARQAQDAAGDLDVLVAGGADVAQQFLQAGLVDEIRIALRPMVIGGGLRLFDGPVELESIDAVWTPEATHLRFRVIR